jgi:hypothetical protein
MCLATVRGRSRPVDRRPHQRMPEPHPDTQLDQPGFHSRRDRADGQAQQSHCAAQQPDIPERLGGGREQRPLRRRRKGLQPTGEASLDLAGQGLGVRQPEPTGQLGRRQPPRQLQQSQRIAPRLGHNPVPYPFVESAGNDRVQQCRSPQQRWLYGDDSDGGDR